MVETAATTLLPSLTIKKTVFSPSGLPVASFSVAVVSAELAVPAAFTGSSASWVFCLVMLKVSVSEDGAYSADPAYEARTSVAPGKPSRPMVTLAFPLLSVIPWRVCGPSPNTTTSPGTGLTLLVSTALREVAVRYGPDVEDSCKASELGFSGSPSRPG